MDFCRVLNQKPESEVIDLFKCELLCTSNKCLQLSSSIKGAFSLITARNKATRDQFNNEVEAAQLYCECSERLIVKP